MTLFSQRLVAAQNTDHKAGAEQGHKPTTLNKEFGHQASTRKNTLTPKPQRPSLSIWLTQIVFVFTIALMTRIFFIGNASVIQLLIRDVPITNIFIIYLPNLVILMIVLTSFILIALRNPYGRWLAVTILIGAASIELYHKGFAPMPSKNPAFTYNNPNIGEFAEQTTYGINLLIFLMLSYRLSFSQKVKNYFSAGKQQLG